MEKKRLHQALLVLALAAVQIGCGGDSSESAKHTPTASEGGVLQVSARSEDSLTDAEARTLESLRKVDDHPLFVMKVSHDYQIATREELQRQTAHVAPTREQQFACSLFAAFDGPDGSLYGRNFDWFEHPALLLFTNPEDGYASVSMVDISYLGYANDELEKLESMDGRIDLLQAPQIPFDGMNEHGLVVGMAAVPATKAPVDDSLPTLASVTMIRVMLDKAKTVDEALAVFDDYNVDFVGGPNIHYLIADRSGKSALVELKDGNKHIYRNDDPWHVATNFYLTGVEGSPHRQCARYANLDERLNKANGAFTVDSAMDALKDVAQETTRWSVIYGIDSGEASLVLSRRFDDRYSISLGEQEIDSQ